VQRIGGRELIVDAVEDVFGVAVGVQGTVFGGVEKASGVGAVNGDEIAPALIAGAEIDRGGRGSKGAVVARDAAMHAIDAEAALGSGADDEAGFVAKLGWGDAADGFHGIDGAGGDLIGEGAALLIVDWLIVDDKRSVGVLAERMEASVGVRDDAG